MSHYKGADIEKDGVLPGYRKNTSLTRVLVDALRKNGNSTALLEPHTGKTASFQELLDKSINIGAGLCALGVAPGDYVIVCCEKSIVAYSIVLGILYTGATAVMPPTLHANIIHKLVRGHVIKAVICDTIYLDTLKASINQLSEKPSLIITTDPRDELLTTLLKPTKEDFKIFEAKDVRKHISTIFFSSGTTGEPKGIQLTDLSVQLLGIYFNHKFKQFMIASPLYWLSAFFPFLSCIFFDFTLVINNSREPKENLAILEKYKVDAWFTSVGSMGRYIREPTLKNFDISSVKRVFVAGEYVLESVAEQFMEKVLGGRVRLEVIYGSTEGGMLSEFNKDLSHETVRVGESGRIYDGVEMKIVDKEGKLVPIGSLGQIWIRTESQTPGYWGRPELLLTEWDKEGFFNTSDVGFFDKDFTLFHRGRINDMIIYDSTMLSPGEAENVMMSHEEVVDAAVVGTPHPTHGQLMTGFVELTPGASITRQQLLHYVNERVEDQRRLRGGLHILNILPRTVIGKVIRKQLREYSIEGKTT